MASALTQPMVGTTEADALVFAYTVAILGSDLNVMDAFAVVQHTTHTPGRESDLSIDERHEICQRVAEAVAEEYHSRGNV